MEFPVPLAAIPVNTSVLSRDHEKVVPEILFGFVMSIWLIAEPGHMVCSNSVADIVGVALT